MGGTVFAGTMMILVGIFHAIAGLAGLFENEFYVSTQQYILQFDVTTWGWIHLIAGVVVALAGWAALSGATWARAVGIVLASFSAVANFAFIPVYPVWSLLIIAADVFVIWALASYNPGPDY